MKASHHLLTAIGAARIAYHEVLRGRQTGTCMDCGRLTHAENDRCLCGGDVEENEHASETLDDPDTSTYDSFEQPVWKYGIPALKVLATLGVVALVVVAIRTDNILLGLTTLTATSLLS